MGLIIAIFVGLIIWWFTLVVRFMIFFAVLMVWVAAYLVSLLADSFGPRTEEWARKRTARKEQLTGAGPGQRAQFAEWFDRQPTARKNLLGAGMSLLAALTVGAGLVAILGIQPGPAGSGVTGLSPEEKQRIKQESEARGGKASGIRIKQPVAPGQKADFQSPGGDVRCVWGDVSHSVYCEIKSAGVFALIDGADGEAVSFSARCDQVPDLPACGPQEGPVLPYGEKITKGDVSCQSDRDAMRCNHVDGRGMAMNEGGSTSLLPR